MLKTLKSWIFWTEVREGAGSLICLGDQRTLPEGTAVRVLRTEGPDRVLVTADSAEQYTQPTARGTYTSNRRPVYSWVTIGQQIPDPKADRPCAKCEGAGSLEIAGERYGCGCHGRMFQAPDVDAIVAAIVSTRGPSKGKLRTSAPDKSNARAYYVWRMARFHGGKDVTLPFTAGIINRCDPFMAELDAIVDAVAQRAFGSADKAAEAWGRALLG